jgi:hypothetical protein
MVQGNRDIRQDVNDILATREELTEKVELLRGRIRGALWQTRHEIGCSIDEVKETVDGMRRMLNPSFQRHGPPLAMIAVILTLRYFLRQWRQKDSALRRQQPTTARRDNARVLERLR